MACSGAAGRYFGTVVLGLCLAGLTACSKDQPAKSAVKPAQAELVAHESELLKLTLTPQAEQRLGLATQRIGVAKLGLVRTTSGELVVPATTQSGVPTASTTDLLVIGAQQIAAEGEIGRARAAVTLNQLGFERAVALLAKQIGTARVRDEAAAALATAQTNLRTAIAQRRLLGPPVNALSNSTALWVKVPASGSDIAAIEKGRAVAVSPLGGGSTRMASPVRAAPSANTAAGTVDLFYALDNRDRRFQVGQRVQVALPMAGASAGLSVPASAIVRDIYGGEWVYQKTAPHAYVRRRIELASSQAGQNVLKRGLEPGTEIVTVGAVELFGTEFGTGK